MEFGIPGGTAAIRAVVREFLQEVLPHLIAEERALLIFDTPDLGVLHLLGIEPHVFDTQRRDGCQAPDFSHGMHRLIDPGLQRRRQPAGLSTAIEKASRQIPRVAKPPTSTDGASCVQPRYDQRLMRNFSQENPFRAALAV